MSRYASGTLAWGWDSATGYFIQEFSPWDIDGEEQLIVDKDTLFDGLDGPGLLKMLENRYKIEVKSNVREALLNNKPI